MALADIMTALHRQKSRFLRSDNGNLTMIGALAAIPIVGAAGMAIDYARISRVQEEIQYATDAATLFAAGAKSLSGTKEQKRQTRQQLATNYLNYALANVTDAEIVGSPTVVTNDVAIDIEVKAKVKGSFTNVFALLEDDAADMEQGGGGDEAGTNGKSFGITVKSKATWAAGVNYVCLLALHPSDPEALVIKGMAKVVSKNCSVQVNSTSNQALSQSGSSSITARKISVKGNYVGSNYSPMPVTNANVFNDPLAAKFATDYNSTYGSAVMRYNSNAQMSFSAGNHTIQPGIYRGGIRVGNSVNLTLAAGTHFIRDGEFEIRSGGHVAGNGVTIVFMGNNKSRILVQAGGSINIKAPGEGLPFSSLAIAQHPDSIPEVNKENLIIGGGNVSMTGIIYFPKQTLKITGGGSISQTAPLFAIAADKIFIEGNAPLEIGQASDSDAAGLPALPAIGTGVAKVTLQ